MPCWLSVRGKPCGESFADISWVHFEHVTDKNKGDCPNIFFSEPLERFAKQSASPESCRPTIALDIMQGALEYGEHKPYMRATTRPTLDQSIVLDGQNNIKVPHRECTSRFSPISKRTRHSPCLVSRLDPTPSSWRALLLLAVPFAPYLSLQHVLSTTSSAKWVCVLRTS